MNNLENLKQRIDAVSHALRTLSDTIWNHPELAYKEYTAAEEAKKFLEAQGFETVNPYCGLDTAFKAEYGSSGPAFAIFA